MAAVKLPQNCYHQDLIEALDEAGVLHESADRIAFQLPAPCFVSTSAMAFLGAWGLLQKRKGSSFTFVGNDDTCKYLSRMDLFCALDIPYTESFKRHSEIGRFIPVCLVDCETSCQKATNSICDLVLHQFDNAREFLPALEWAVNEVVDNILLHSETPVPGVVCAQYFPNRQRLDVGICDMGRGIKASLEESMTLWSHGDAVTKALERGVTRNPDVGMGNGLTGNLEIAKVNGGGFQLWTGDVTYRLSDGQEKGFIQHPIVQGTGAFLSLDTRRAVKLSETFIAEVAYNYIEAEAERIVEEGGLKVREECAYTGVREFGNRLRRKILSLLPEMEDTLVLDFKGVESAASSFLDELLGRLVAELGKEHFRKKIRVVNLSDQVRRMANVVIAQRLDIDLEQ